MANNSKQKILFVITKSVWGGAQKYVYDLAKNLPKDLFEASVATGPGGDLVYKLADKNIPCFIIQNFQRDINVFKEFFSYFELLNLYLKIRPDIIHTNSSKAAGLAGAAAWHYKLLTKNFKVKTIFTAHGWGFHESRPGWQIFLIKFFSFLTALFYNKIICVSEYDKKSAVKNHIAKKEKLVTIHSGIKSGDYDFLTKEKARQLINNGSENEIWFGTIGELTKNKGHKYLIGAVQKLKTSLPKINFKIFIIGDGENKQKLLQQIGKLNLVEKVFLINRAISAAQYLKAFNFFILPSIKEGLPYVLLEAGLAGLPVIATGVGGIPEMIDPQFLVKPADSEELKTAMTTFLNNPELAKKSAEALHEKIVNEFSFEKMLELTLSVYK